MNYLFADSSVNETYMQIGSNSSFIGQEFDTKQTLGAEISVLCDEMLKKQGLSIEQIDLFAVCTGPGSLTGLRVALSFFKTLAMLANKPIVGISLFQWAAQTLLNAGVTGSVSFYLPALIDKAFKAEAQLKNGVFSLTSPELCGRGCIKEQNAYGIRYEAEGLKPLSPTGEAINKLILQNDGKKADFNEALGVLPLYVIASQAERRLNKTL